MLYHCDRKPLVRGMRNLQAVLVWSSIIIPSNPNPSHNPNKPKPKPKPKPFSLFTTTTTTTKVSPPNSSSSSSRPPLLSTVRWDLASSPPRRSRLRYYADLASKLAENGKLEEFSMVVESVVALGVLPLKFAKLLNVELVSKGIAGVIGEGRVWSVVEFLSGVRKLGIAPAELFDASARELLARECRRILSSGEVEEFVGLMETLSGFDFAVKEVVEPSKIIQLCVNTCNPNMALRYACIFPHAQVLYCDIIHEFGKRQDLASALTVFEASNQRLSHPNMFAYRTIIDVCGICCDHLKSRSIYEELLAQKVTPNIYVFNSLMNVNSHDLSYTLYIYNHMQILGVAADMASYNILLKSCCLAARTDLAQEIYGEVQQLESSGLLKLDVYTYSTIIKAFADAKLWQMALKVKEDMKSAGVTPNTITWSSLIGACANAGLVEQAIQLFEEMRLAGCEPNTQCCNILLHACVEACQYDRAFRLFQSWKESGFQKTNTHENRVSTRPNCVSGSHNLRLAIMVPFNPTIATYNILMKACGTDYFHAKSLMDEMKTVGLSPNHISWSTLIGICGGSGNVNGAMQILKSMHEAGVQPDVIAYTTAIKVCVESQNLKIAFSLFAEMKRCRIQPNLVTYNTLLRARSRYGSLQEVQQCLAIYQDMRKAGYKSNDYYLKQLIEEWCEGVLQDNNQNKGQLSSCNRADLGGPQSLLLEKVAAHLHRSNTESLAIDLQGLTKVEARIVVLAVLRMIKEKLTLGNSIKDDMFIILGIQEEIGGRTAKHNSKVEDAIIKLLRDELGLEVLLEGPRIALDRKFKVVNPLKSHQNLEEVLGSRLPTDLKPSTRRPAVLQRLKVTKRSLHNWLQRRVGAFSR